MEIRDSVAAVVSATIQNGIISIDFLEPSPMAGYAACHFGKELTEVYYDYMTDDVKKAMGNSFLRSCRKYAYGKYAYVFSKEQMERSKARNDTKSQYINPI